MGDGTKIRFWYDLCCGDQPLKDFFPELFSIARCKEVWVTIKIAVSNGNIQWNVSFIRPVQD
jgi:predicted TIM-barrel fold metal-dependent hydrolase